MPQGSGQDPERQAPRVNRVGPALDELPQLLHASLVRHDLGRLDYLWGSGYLGWLNLP